MVHGDDAVELSGGGAVEEGIGGVGSGAVDTLLAGEHDCGGDDPFFLVAELAVLSGVGVEGGDGDIGSWDIEILLEGGIEQVDGFEYAADGEFVADLEEGFVDGGKRHLEGACDEHHGLLGGFALVGEHLGMAGPVDLGVLPTELADRRCDDGVDYSVGSGGDGVEAESDGGLSGDSGGSMKPRWDVEVVIVGDNDIARVVAGDLLMLVPDPVGFDLGGVGGVGKLLVHSEDDELGLSADERIGEGFYDDLRAYAARVAHGNAYRQLIAEQIVVVLLHIPDALRKRRNRRR